MDQRKQQPNNKKLISSTSTPKGKKRPLTLLHGLPNAPHNGLTPPSIIVLDDDSDEGSAGIAAARSRRFKSVIETPTSSKRRAPIRASVSLPPPPDVRPIQSKTSSSFGSYLPHAVGGAQQRTMRTRSQSKSERGAIVNEIEPKVILRKQGEEKENAHSMTAPNETKQGKAAMKSGGAALKPKKQPRPEKTVAKSIIIDLTAPGEEVAKPADVSKPNNSSKSNEPVIALECVAANTSTASAKPPLAVSTDGAKDASVIIDTASSTPFAIGDLYWGQIYNYCYWPCMVCPDPDGQITCDNDSGRQSSSPSEEFDYVHVRFFADNMRRNWVKRENLISYMGMETYEELVFAPARERYGEKSAKLKLFWPKRRYLCIWKKAIAEANRVSEVQQSERLEMFYKIFDEIQQKKKEARKMRQSFDRTVDISCLYDSSKDIQPVEATKRNNSVPPDETISKRAKQSDIEQDPKQNEQEVEPGPSTSTNSIPDMVDEADSEFKEFHTVMRSFVLGQCQGNEAMEYSLIRALRNLWLVRKLSQEHVKRQMLENLSKQELGSSVIDVANESNETIGLKRVSNRLMSIAARRNLSEDGFRSKLDGSSTAQQ